MSKGQARTVRFKTLYGGQFTLSTELLKPNIMVLMKLRVILVHHVKHVTNPATQLCVTRLCHIRDLRGHDRLRKKTIRLLETINEFY